MSSRQERVAVNLALTLEVAEATLLGILLHLGFKGDQLFPCRLERAEFPALVERIVTFSHEAEGHDPGCGLAVAVLLFSVLRGTIDEPRVRRDVRKPIQTGRRHRIDRF